MKNLSLGFCAFLLAAFALGQGYKPPSGYVPDSATAIKIAEAVLEPVYGKKQIESEKSFTAKLKGDVWSVAGTLRCPAEKGGTSTDCDGGVATVKISKADARILFHDPLQVRLSGRSFRGSFESQAAVT